MYEMQIYLYRKLPSGLPFYVGVTADLVERDYNHFRDISSTVRADKAFVASGRSNFQLEVLETVRGEDLNKVRREAHTRENEYIISLRTLQAFGGGNQALNPTKKEKEIKKCVNTHISADAFEAFERLRTEKGVNMAEFLRGIVLEYLVKHSDTCVE